MIKGWPPTNPPDPITRRAFVPTDDLFTRAITRGMRALKRLRKNKQ